MALSVEALDVSTIERAGALVAREQAAARRTCPPLPARFATEAVCTEALQRLVDAGARGVVAGRQGRTLAVMTAAVRDSHVVGRYARLAAEGLAADPEVEDPTSLLATMFGALAAPLVADGVARYFLLHVAAPRLPEAVANLGFGRQGVYAVQPAAPRPPRPQVSVRIAGPDELDTIAHLSLVELRHRVAPPMFGPAIDSNAEDLLAQHRALHEAGAVHLVASLDGRDVGLLTVEPASPAPRLCPDGQPYIGPTATVADARRRGVGQALVDAALDWAHRQGHHWVSVDFEASNPLSRPFWLGTGFEPTGFALTRYIG